MFALWSRECENTRSLLHNAFSATQRVLCYTTRSLLHNANIRKADQCPIMLLGITLAGSVNVRVMEQRMRKYGIALHTKLPHFTLQISVALSNLIVIVNISQFTIISLNSPSGYKVSQISQHLPQPFQLTLEHKGWITIAAVNIT